MYRNSEGYADPTAGEAMGKIMGEYRRSRKKTEGKTQSGPPKRQSRDDREKCAWPVAYVVSQYAGDVDANVRTAIRCCRFLIRQKKVPVASHLMYPQMLRDSVPEERALGLRFGLALLALCEEVWVFTRDGIVSEGMAGEIAEAKRLGKPVHYVKVAR